MTELNIMQTFNPKAQQSISTDCKKCHLTSESTCSNTLSVKIVTRIQNQYSSQDKSTQMFSTGTGSRPSNSFTWVAPNWVKIWAAFLLSALNKYKLVLWLQKTGLPTIWKHLNTPQTINSSRWDNSNLPSIRDSVVKHAADTVPQHFNSASIRRQAVRLVVGRCDVCPGRHNARILLPHRRQSNTETHATAYRLMPQH